MSAKNNTDNNTVLEAKKIAKGISIMAKGLLIGGSVVVAGVFVGFVVYKIVKKNPKLLKNTRKKISNIRQKTSEVIAETKRAFTEGFEDAQAEVTAA